MRRFTIFVLICLASLLLASSCYAQGFMIKSHFYKHMQGNIGAKYDIVLDLERNDSTLQGYYYYLKTGKPIRVEGRIDEKGYVQLNEYTDTSVTATIQARFLTDSILQGRWIPKAGSPTTFAVREHYASGSLAMAVEALKQDYTPDKKSRKAVYDVSMLHAVSGAPAKVLDSVNNLVAAKAEGQDEPVSLHEAAQNYFNGYEEDMGDIGPDQNRVIEYYYIARTYVAYNARNVLSLVSTSYEYTGGAHGNGGSEGIVISLKDGHQIDEDEFFKEDFDDDALSALIEKKLRQMYHIPASKSLHDAGFLTDEVDASDNFYLSSGGITFIYNPYEIAPYVMGEIDVYIPYSEMKDFLEPGALPFGK